MSKKQSEMNLNITIQHIGQDIHTLNRTQEEQAAEIKEIKENTLVLEIPATPEHLQKYGNAEVKVTMPEGFKNAVYAVSEGENKNGNLVFIGDAYTTYSGIQPKSIKLVRLAASNDVVKTLVAQLEPKSVQTLENLRKAEEERKAAEKRAEEERKAKEQKERLIYLYLAKWLTENHLQKVRETDSNAYVNKNGLNDLLVQPFEKAEHYTTARKLKADLSPIKEELQQLKTRLDAGDLDASSAAEFIVPAYKIDYAQL